MSVHTTVKTSYLAANRAIADNQFAVYKWFIEQEVNSWGEWVDLPLTRRLWLWRHGFTSPCGKLYDFESYSHEDYLSELQRYRLYRRCNRDHRYLLDDKLCQYWMLADDPEHRPTAYGLLDRGYIHGVAGTEDAGETAPIEEWLPAKLTAESRLVLKQLRGKGGTEVHVCAATDDGYTLNGEPVAEDELCASVAELAGYLVTEYVDQHAYANELYADAANTMRFLTVWDDSAGELHIPAAMHRIGTDRSQPVDNLNAGGLTAALDVERGELGPAAQLPQDGAVTWYDTHPETAAQIAGRSIPHWERIRSTVERLARNNTNIPIIGWDILLDERGEPIVLEANTGTGVFGLQVHQALLADPAFSAVAAQYLDGVSPPADR